MKTPTDLIVNTHLLGGSNIVEVIENSFNQRLPFGQLRYLANDVLGLLICHLASNVAKSCNEWLNQAIEKLTEEGDVTPDAADRVCYEVLNMLERYLRLAYGDRWAAKLITSNVVINYHCDIILYEYPASRRA